MEGFKTFCVFVIMTAILFTLFSVAIYNNPIEMFIKDLSLALTPGCAATIFGGLLTAAIRH